LARAASCCRSEEHDDSQPKAAAQLTASRFALPRLDTTAASQRRGTTAVDPSLPLVARWLLGYTARPREVPPCSRPAGTDTVVDVRRGDARSDTTHAAEPLRDRSRRDGTMLPEDAMAEIEYAVDIWDLSGTDGRPNAEQLLEHLRNFAEEGWELVSLSFNIDLVRHGPSHLLVFKRAGG
jgi:hypothetical protein